LIKDLSSVFPVISPIIDFNPLKDNSRMPGRPVPSKLPPMAEALSPEEWVAYHGIPVHQGQMDTHYVRKAFAKQLKDRWQGIQNQPNHIKALFAAFALKNAKRREGSDQLLGEIAQCWSLDKGLDLSHGVRRKIKSILKDPNLGGAMAKVADNHGFTTTAMMKCLQNARQQGGVLAPATFVWLRAEDRTLWYPLNNLGRRSYHSEAAGAMAHFRSEKIAGRPIPTPKVKSAVEGLQNYLNSTAIPIPERDYSGEGKASGARAPKTA
jgi:intracellular multiplication protein IcmP